VPVSRDLHANATLVPSLDPSVEAEMSAEALVYG
jgi:hypothetical protein